MKKLHLRLVATIVIALVASLALATGKITSFAAKAHGKGAIITVTGTDIGKPKITTAYAGSVVIFEFNAVLTANTTLKRLNTDFASYAKIAQFTAKPPVVRVVAKVSPTATITTEKTESGWTILIGSPSLANDASNTSADHEPTLIDRLEAAKQADKKAFEAAMATLNGASKAATEPTTPKSEIVTISSTVKTAPPEPTSDGTKATEPASGSYHPGAQRRVSLDFVDTQVVIVLKALAEQSGANIVTAPSVQGSVSVTLKNVTVQEALDLVTKLAGVRYAYVNGTYLVGPPDFMRSMMMQESGAEATGTVMRIVPLASRKAGEIKRAITQAMTMDVLNETIQIINPAVGTEPTQPAPAKNGEGGSQVTTQTPAIEGGDADYLIVIGESSRVNQAVLLISQLDEGLAKMHGIEQTGADALRPVSKAYMVRGGNAVELAAAIEKFASGVTVVATPATSSAGQSLVITGRPADVDRVLQVLAQIDDVTVGGEWTVEVYDVKYADPRALQEQIVQMFHTVRVVVGPQGASGRSYTPPGANAGAQGGGPAGGSQNQGSGGIATSAGFKASPQYGEDEARAVPMALVLSGPRDDVHAAMQMLAKLDRKTPEIVIEARVVDANKEDLLKLGIDWSAVTGSSVKIINLKYGQPAGADGSPFTTITGRFAGPGWLATGIANLDKLISRDKILARPNVRAMDGREAVVFMGDIVRYIKSIQATQNGITVEVGEEEVGVKLNVLPRITRDGMIIMDVQPTLSFIKQFLEVPGGGQIPTTSIRTARSTLTMRSGDTIAIGGLISDEDRKSVTGFPILMDIPVIGQFFRRETTSTVRREIIIFLSARIVDDSEGSDSQSESQPAGTPKSSGG